MNCLIIETVSFKLASGVSEEAFIKTTEAVGDFLQTCDGFSQRRLSKSEDGRWLEHVEWETLEKAEAASKSFCEQDLICNQSRKRCYAASKTACVIRIEKRSFIY